MGKYLCKSEENKCKERDEIENVEMIEVYKVVIYSNDVVVAGHSRDSSNISIV